jgi:hypothetical protein
MIAVTMRENNRKKASIGLMQARNLRKRRRCYIRRVQRQTEIKKKMRTCRFQLNASSANLACPAVDSKLHRVSSPLKVTAPKNPCRTRSIRSIKIRVKQGP